MSIEINTNNYIANNLIDMVENLKIYSSTFMVYLEDYYGESDFFKEHNNRVDEVIERIKFLSATGNIK